MGEHGGLPSMGLHRVGHDWSDLAATAYLIEELEKEHSVSRRKKIISSQIQTQRSIEQNTFSINKPAHLDQLIYNKVGKYIQWRKYSMFNK